MWPNVKRGVVSFSLSLSLFCSETDSEKIVQSWKVTGDGVELDPVPYRGPRWNRGLLVASRED